MKTVKEVSRLTGVSVRALHHYDAIGLLRPAKITEAGYRLYDEENLRRLQQILLFRELQFPLKEIAAILDSPGFDPDEALRQQIRLLELRRERLDALIGLARDIQQKGVSSMNFDAFDTGEIDRYAAEAKERWGNTDLYHAYEQKTRGQSAADQKQTGEALMALLAETGALRPLRPESEAVQQKIAALQAFISEHYYPCSKEVLSGLGEMYVCDERMRENIDQAGGEGTAAFVRDAIMVFCGR